MKAKYKNYIPAFIMLLMIMGSAVKYPASAPAPDFTLKRLDGSSFRLSDQIGKKVIIIDFWATWCKPCKKMLKELNQIYLDNKENVEVLAITIDDSSALSQVETYIKGKGYSFTVLLDTEGQVARIFNPAMKIPFNLIVDKKGKIVYTHTGYIPGFEVEIIKKIEVLRHE